MNTPLRYLSELLKPAPPVVAVGGVIYRKNRRHEIEVLLIKKQGGYWTLPKGHVEEGESHFEAVRREMREETGLYTAVQSYVCAVSYIVLKAGMPRTKIVTYYLLRARRGRLRPSQKEHIVRIKWFTVAEALRRIKRPRVRTIVQHANAMLESPKKAQPHV